jgi:predicted RND superfamily exporter protein
VFIDSNGSGVGGVLGPPELLTTTNYLISGRNEEARRIPEEDDQIESLWGYYSRLLGPERLRESITPDFESCLVTVFLKNANYVDTARLMQAIRVYEHDHLQGAGLRLDFGGDVAVSQDLITAVVSTQIRSLLVALAGILAALIALNRSAFWGILATLPCIAAVAFNLAVMGWLGIPLGVATSMFAAMALGLGDSFSIHLVERYRLEIARGASHPEALRTALRIVGPATCIDALAVAFGFGILILSQVPANARLGVTTLVTVASCVFTTLLILPPIISTWARAHQATQPSSPRTDTRLDVTPPTPRQTENTGPKSL